MTIQRYELYVNYDFAEMEEDEDGEYVRFADHAAALAAAKAEGVREGMLKAAEMFSPDFEMRVIGIDSDAMARVEAIIRAAAQP